MACNLFTCMIIYKHCVKLFSRLSTKQAFFVKNSNAINYLIA